MFRSYRRLLLIFWTCCVFEPFFGLRATYAVHLRLIGKLLFMLVELISLGVTAEGLRRFGGHWSVWTSEPFLHGLIGRRMPINFVADKETL